MEFLLPFFGSRIAWKKKQKKNTGYLKFSDKVRQQSMSKV